MDPMTRVIDRFLRRQPSTTPRRATITAACSRPQSVMPPNRPTTHQRLVAQPQAMPAMPSSVTVCGHTASAAIVHTGVAKPRTATAMAARRSESCVRSARNIRSRARAAAAAAVSPPGTTLIESARPSVSAIQYAGRPMAITPGNREITSPSSVSMIQIPASGLSTSPGIGSGPRIGEPVCTRCQDA